MKPINYDIKVATDVAFNPQKYISYDKFVKKAILDHRPFRPLMLHAVVGYPSAINGQMTIFKVDGIYVHKKVSDSYIMLSPTMLEAYGRTPEEFWKDWHLQHPDGK